MRKRDNVNLRKSELQLSRPALLTNNHIDHKSKKYQLDFANKRDREGDNYLPTDRYEKRVLNAQQSLPDYQTHRRQNGGDELDRSPRDRDKQYKRQQSLEDDRNRRFSKAGAAQLFPSFNSNSNLFSNLIKSNNSPSHHIGIDRGATLNQLRMDLNKSSETKGFPTRQAEERRKSRLDVRKSK